MFEIGILKIAVPVPGRTVSKALLEAVSDPVLYPSLTISLATLEKYSEDICRVLSGLSSLREFRLVKGDWRDSTGSYQGFKIPVGLFQTLGAACPALRSLELHADNATLDEESFSRLEAGGIRLRRLVVHNCFSLTDSALAALAAEELCEVELCWCGSLTDRGVAGLLARTGRLHQLTLNNDFRLTDAVLYALAANISKSGFGSSALTTLNLNFLSNISDNGFQVLLSAGGGQNLSRVSLRYTSITDQSLYRLAAACPNLTELDLKLCRLISDKGVRAVCEQRGHSLQLLNLGKSSWPKIIIVQNISTVSSDK
jgi:Leucine Rich repeat